MSKIILTLGVSNAGKSTYAHKYIQENPNTIELNRDQVRFTCVAPHASSYDDYPFTDYSEEYVSEIIHNQLLLALKQGKDVIVSDTNLSPYTRAKWIQIANDFNCDMEYVIFHSHFEQLFYKSDSTTLFQLPDHVVNNQYKKFTHFLDEHLNPQINYSFI